MARPLKVARNVLALASLVLVVFLWIGPTSGAQVHLETGSRAVVFGVGPTGLAVREGPGLRFRAFAVVPLGAEVDVVEGPAWSASIPWYLISGFGRWGGQGWAAGNYLQPVETAASGPSDESGPLDESDPPHESGLSDEADPSDEAEASEADARSERMTSARGAGRTSRSFIATVVGYSLNGRTATGTPTGWGVVAVDPSVVPLGSKLQIDGFEEIFVAADTGGAVHGNIIDVWFPSHAEARQFGVQARRVTILDP